MQVGIFNFLFNFIIAALTDYVIVASIIVIAIRNSINCAALAYIYFFVNNNKKKCYQPIFLEYV